MFLKVLTSQLMNQTIKNLIMMSWMMMIPVILAMMTTAVIKLRTLTAPLIIKALRSPSKRIMMSMK